MPNPPMREYPLIHDYQIFFELDCNAANSNSTIIPLFMNHRDRNESARDVHVNPGASGFTSVAHPFLYPESRVNKLFVNVQMKQKYDVTIKGLKYDTMLVCNAFDDVNETGIRDTTKAGTVIELESAADGDCVNPRYTGNDLLNASSLPTPPTGLTFADYGLSIDNKLEEVNFDKQEFLDSYYGSNNPEIKGLIRKMTSGYGKVRSNVGGLHEHMITHDFLQSTGGWWNVPGYIKRANLLTFCGILYHMPLGHDVEPNGQLYTAGDMATTGRILFSMHVRYNEYNDMFDMSAADV